MCYIYTYNIVSFPRQSISPQCKPHYYHHSAGKPRAHPVGKESVQSNNHYYSSQLTNVNFVRPYARTNYLYYSFVPNVVHAWNNLPYFIKTSPCISTFKSSLLYHFYQAHTCIIISSCYIMLLLSIGDIKKIK